MTRGPFEQVNEETRKGGIRVQCFAANYFKIFLHFFIIVFSPKLLISTICPTSLQQVQGAVIVDINELWAIWAN